MESTLLTFREDLLDESVLKTYGIVSLEKANKFHMFLAALICANRDDLRLARVIDREFFRAIEEEGYLSIPEILCEPASLCVDQQVTYFIERRLWNYTRIENTLVFYQQSYSSLLERLDEIRNFAETYRKTFEGTRLGTFDALAKTHMRYLGYCEELRVVLTKAIAILSAAVDERTNS